MAIPLSDIHKYSILSIHYCALIKMSAENNDRVYDKERVPIWNFAELNIVYVVFLLFYIFFNINSGKFIYLNFLLYTYNALLQYYYIYFYSTLHILQERKSSNFTCFACIIFWWLTLIFIDYVLNFRFICKSCLLLS